MFERFTDRARRVIALAQEEARTFRLGYVGTEHILLGLVHADDSGILKELVGIPLQDVRSQVEEITGQGQQAPSGHIPFTPRAKKVLELSLREALQLGHNYIGPEHILLGLIREASGRTGIIDQRNVAAQVLVNLGVDLDELRSRVMKRFMETPKNPPEETSYICARTFWLILRPYVRHVLTLELIKVNNEIAELNRQLTERTSARDEIVAYLDGIRVSDMDE